MGRKKVAKFSEIVEPYLKLSTHLKDYRNKVYICGVLVRQFGDKKVTSFNAAFIKGYRTELLNAGKAKATVNRCISQLSVVLKTGWELGMVPQKTITEISSVKQLKEENQRNRILSSEEFEGLLKICANSRALYLLQYVLLPLNSGMRRGEVDALQWEYIDIEHGFIRIPTSKNGDPRVIPINKNMANIIKSLPRQESGKVFPSHYYSAWCYVRKKMGLENFTYHDLRHTCASWLAMSGVDMFTLRDILGHKNVSTTNRYSHVANASKVAAMSKLDSDIPGMMAINF